MMILEVAEVHVKEGTGADFETAVYKSRDQYISQTDGYISMEVQRGIENPNRYLLLIKWATLEAHTMNFRESDVFPKHRDLISPYFAKPPFVEHFELAE
ncbi:MAG: antibiotic biosynthesis monooxygenase [Chloroflexota bacterium]